jgi:hypothetical protein
MEHGGIFSIVRIFFALQEQHSRESRLPKVAKNDFLQPIEANFDGLNAGGQKALKTLIYQRIYRFLRWFFVLSQAK